MKRFWVFKGDVWYPVGGMEDFWADFDSLPEASEQIQRLLPRSAEPAEKQWLQIFDSERREFLNHDLLLVDGQHEWVCTDFLHKIDE